MKKLSKIFAVVLVLAMVLSVLPLGAGAIAATAGATATLVTDASTLAAGDQIVIVAKNVDYILSTTQNSNNRTAVAVTKNGNSVTLSANAEVLTLKAGTAAGSFAFAVADGSYLYAASTSSNHLKLTSTLDAKASFSIAIANGVATIQSVGNTDRGLLCYNPNANGSNPLFSCYATTTSCDPELQIYKLATAVQDTREDLPTATADIVNAIYALQAGESLDKYYKFDSFTMAGTIVTATEVWNEEYSNGTITIKVDGTDKDLVVFRYKAGTVDVEEIKALAVGDKVTFNVTSAKNYSGTLELDQPTLTAIQKAANDDTNNDNDDDTTDEDSAVQEPDKVGDSTAIVAMTSIMVVAVVALAVLVIGKKRMF